MKPLLILICVTLCSCSLFRVKTCPSCHERPELQIEQTTEKIKLNSVEFKVLTRENSELYFLENKSAFVLTEDEYKNLSLNVEIIKSYIKKQMKIIKLYRDYYEGEDNG